MSDDKNNRIKSIMAAVFGVDVATISHETTSYTIENWDSLKHMNLIIAIEKEFDMTFEDDDILEMISFKTICDKVS